MSKMKTPPAAQPAATSPAATAPVAVAAAAAEVPVFPTPRSNASSYDLLRGNAAEAPQGENPNKMRDFNFEFLPSDRLPELLSPYGNSWGWREDALASSGEQAGTSWGEPSYWRLSWNGPANPEPIELEFGGKSFFLNADGTTDCPIYNTVHWPSTSRQAIDTARVIKTEGGKKDNQQVWLLRSRAAPFPINPLQQSALICMSEKSVQLHRDQSVVMQKPGQYARVWVAFKGETIFLYWCRSPKDRHPKRTSLSIADFQRFDTELWKNEPRYVTSICGLDDYPLARLLFHRPDNCLTLRFNIDVVGVMH